jgi:hypothetical protein
MKNVRDIENYARQIKEAGLERDLVGTGLHHYYIDVEFVKGKDTNDIIMSMPSAFEGCFDYKNGDGKRGTVCMFYLENCTVTDAATVVSWLKSHDNWKTRGYAE